MDRFFNLREMDDESDVRLRDVFAGTAKIRGRPSRSRSVFYDDAGLTVRVPGAPASPPGKESGS